MAKFLGMEEEAMPLQFTNISFSTNLLTPIPKKNDSSKKKKNSNTRNRTMSDESDWHPLPDDPSLLIKHLEEIKISETK